MHHKRMKLFSRICLIGCIFLFISCGTRKREVQRSNTKVDVITNETFDKSKVSDKTSIVLSDETSFTLEPVNPTLPIIYRRDTIYNSKVIYQKVLRDSITRIRDTVYIKYESEKSDHTETSTENIKTDSKRGDPWKNIGTPIGIGIGAAIIVGVILWFVGKRKKRLPLP